MPENILLTKKSAGVSVSKILDLDEISFTYKGRTIPGEALATILGLTDKRSVDCQTECQASPPPVACASSVPG